MIRNLLVFVRFATSSCVVLYGQTPEPKKPGENTLRTFAWSFDSDGGYLGVQTQEVNKSNFAKYGLSDVRGVAVEKVLENSPAQAAGLQNGDVIVRFNDDEVTSTRKLTRLISEVAPDHQAKVTVLRNGTERDMTVTIGKHPAEKFDNGNFEWSMPMGEMPKLPAMPKVGQMPRIQVGPGVEGNTFVWSTGGRRIGVGVMPVTKQLGDYFGVGEGGLLINSVRENSPAAKAGLKAGDVIVEIDGTAVKEDFDIIKALNEKKQGDVELTIVRDHNRQTIRVTPETIKNDLTPLLQVRDGEGPMIVAPGGLKNGMAPAPTILMVPGHVI